MSRQTIMINVGRELFQNVNPMGLIPDASAARYVRALRDVTKEEFPDARVYVRFLPTGDAGPEIDVIPEAPEAAKRTEELAVALRSEPDVWLRADATVLETMSIQ